MKKRMFSTFAVLAVAGLVAGLAALPAVAGAGNGTPPEVLPKLTVTKVVERTDTSYDIPSDQLFTIQVSCYESEGEIKQQGGDEGLVASLTYNGDGSTHSAPGGWVPSGNSWTLQGWDLKKMLCTVTEQAGGATQYLASDPTYACSFTNTPVSNEKEEEVGEEGGYADPGCVSTDGTDPAMVQFSSPYHSYSCDEPTADVGAAFNGTYCAQAGVVTVTNVIATDPAKVASEAVAIEPKFTG